MDHSNFCSCLHQMISSLETPSDWEVQRDAMNICLRYCGERPRSKSKLGKLRDRLFDCGDLIGLLCCPPWPDSIFYKAAFMVFPTASYEFIPFGQEHPDKNRIEYRIQPKPALSLYLQHTSRVYQTYVPQLRCFFIESDFAGRIACVFATRLSKNPQSTPFTLLYSHSSGCDLGALLGYVIVLAKRYGVNVFCYDYAGFGQSGGDRCEATVYKSAEAAYDYVTTILKVPPEQIIALGTSLGTAASVYIASTRTVGGVILQGAFLSSFRVICPVKRRVSDADTFENIDRIDKVSAPTLIVHGKEDELFSLRHAKLLRRSCPGAAGVEPLFLANCGHIDFEDRPEYWARMHKFLHEELTCGGEDNCCTYRLKNPLRSAAESTINECKDQENPESDM